MARVGVVIVTYRSAATIGACVGSLRGASGDPIEIVVVDNASDDGTVGAATSADAGLVVVSRPSNDGYGVANNAGVAALSPDTEFVVLANPDTVWPAGAIDALVQNWEPSVGLLSPVLVNRDGSAQAIVEDDLTLRRTLLGMTRLAAPVRPRVPSAAGGLVDVDWVHTAAAVMPVSVFAGIGGFDERFFLFAEDADLCRRVRASGKRVVVASEVEVHHAGGASFDVSGTADDTA
ncbi:MAG: N-acetylglucosaminyl-diphospho-decaprenol L-rhamnosyltransferase, partial [Actinomycetota bacterium]